MDENEKKTVLHDSDIREPLFEFLDEVYGKNRIIEEKTMGKSRADIVMVTPEDLYGIEIKSDADTYTRLSSQVKDYDRYYDYNYVVAGTSHAAHIGEHVPPYWGIITVEMLEEGPDFYILRKPHPNPKVKLSKKLEILWRPELAEIQNWNNMPKYKDESKEFVKGKILERVEKGKIDEAVLKKQISDILFERDYSRVKELLQEFRKSETARKLEKEKDPEKQIELMMQRENARRNFKHRKKRRR